MAIKIQKIENNGIVYADPADPGLSIRFKQTSQGKSLNGVPVENHVTEIIINDDNQVTVAGSNAIDAISVRLRISGSAQSKARVKALLGVLASTNAWADEDVFSGFRPVTPPSIT